MATQSVMLKWNPSADAKLTGYRIYYGTVSHDYKTVLAVGNVTNTTISGLSDGTTYFFAATTTDSGGNESDFSNEATIATATAIVPVTGNHPPTLNDLTNLTIYQNAGSQTVALLGITSGSANEKQLLNVTVRSSNPNLIPAPTVKYTSPKSTGTLALKPSAASTGTSVITVTINDGGASNNIVSKAFSVMVIAPPNPAAPKFTKPLTNTFATAGQTISLAVAVTGRAPFKYQWKLNGRNLATTTTATLLLKNVKASQSGAYSVTVSNEVGSTNSVVALLAIYTTTAATLTPASRANGQFSFAVAGVPGYKYVVQRSSDLRDWEAVQTNAAPFVFTDTNAKELEKRFYRTYYLP